MRAALILLLVAVVTSQALKCDEQMEEQCSYDQQWCDLGYDESGCWLGSYCEETIGPMRCNVQCECMYGEMHCDDWVGDLECPTFTCIPAPTGQYDCPAFCPTWCDPMMEETCTGMRLTPDGCLDADTCVPYGTECPYDWNGCQYVDSPECGPDEYPCDFDYDSVGCPVPGTAVCISMDGGECPAQTYGPDGCPIIEEIECMEYEARCEDYFGYAAYDYYGCKIESGMACYDPESDPYASTCEYPYDPAVEQLCDLGVDEYGSDSRYSIPYDDGAGCPMYCDVLCGDDEEACYDYDSYGCQAAPYCVPMGECYMTYDYYGCPIYEPVEPNDDEMVCTGAYYNGCYDPDYTIPMESSPGCPNFCPQDCGPYGMSCYYPADPDDPASCDFEECGWAETDYSGEYCPTVCPAYCSGDQMQCDGGYDERGCPNGDYCMDLDYNDDGGCFAGCPAPPCLSSEISCQEYDDEGCLMQDYCMAANYLSWTNQVCEQYCPTTCGEEEMYCDGQYDERGCQGLPTCVSYDDEYGCPDMYEFYDEQGCPSYSAIYVECDPYYELDCHGGYDEYTGCDMGNFCQPREGYGCDDSCPLMCQYYERQCGGYADEYGCTVAYSCVGTNDLCPEEWEQYYNYGMTGRRR